VAVHRDGQYTVELEDGGGRLGAYRIGPASFDEDGEAVRAAIETGKQSLITTLVDELAGIRDVTRRLTDRENSGVLDRLSRAHEQTAGAATAAEQGDGRLADEQLSTVVSLLTEARELLVSGDQPYSDAAVAALDPRILAAVERAESAVETALSS